MHHRLPNWVASLALLTLFAVPLKAADPDPVYDGKHLSEWVKQLKSKKEADRKVAGEALSSLATESRAVVPALLAAVADGEETNQSAVSALIRIGPDAVPAITAALWDDDPRKRGTALFVLGRLGAKARSATGAVLVALGDSDPQNRSQAARILGWLGSPSAVPALLPLLDQDDSELREDAFYALMDLRADSKVLLPVLLKWLRSKDAERRKFATWHVGDLGPEGAPAVAALEEALKDESLQLQWYAVKSLGQIGPAAKGAAPALAATLKDFTLPDIHLSWAETLWRIARHPDVAPLLKEWLKKEFSDKGELWRVETAELLWRIEKSPDAITALAEVLKRGTKDDKMGALKVVFQIGPEARAALPAVLPLLKDEEKELRLSAAFALGRFGEHGKPAIREVAGALEDKDPSVRLAAALALWRINGDREALKRLREGLRAEGADLRAAAVSQFARMGKSAKEAAPAVREALKDKAPAVRQAAATALGAIDDGPDSLAAVVAVLRDRDPAVRAAAAVSLGIDFATQGKSIVPALTKALWDEDSSVRSNAAEALGRIGPEAKAATRALIAVLRSEELESEPSAAAEALGLIGPAAKEALPVLREKLKHPDSYVRACAALALWNIDRDKAGATVAAAALDDRRARVRVVAAEALWRTKESPRAVPVLVEVLRQAGYDKGPSDEPDNERYMAARALGRIGPPAKDAVPDLLDLLGAAEPFLRATVEAALKRIDPEAARKAKVP